MEERGSRGLQEEDCSWRSGGTGQQTRRARMRRMPAPARAQQVPGGTSTLGITHHLKDYGRVGRGPPRWRKRNMARRDFGKERHDAPGSAVGKDLDEALHHTIQICRSAGFKPSNGV